MAGACHQAVTTEEKTVAAIVDTVVPGRQSDPEGDPGAIDSCAVNLIYDEFWPFVSALPLILSLVNNLASDLHSKTFLECDLKQRTQVLAQAETKLPLIRLAYRFIRSAFYAVNFNMVGAGYLSWPGPNLGYLDHEEFSFRKPVSKELTKDGNLP